MISDLERANVAYESLKNQGPFYGHDTEARPTFRIAAEPLALNESYKETFIRIGEAILAVSQVLDKSFVAGGEQLHYSVPLSWRIDAIIDEDSCIKLNEINVPDGADALMMAEQQAYDLTPPFGISTAQAYVKYFDRLRAPSDAQSRICIIAESMDKSPYTPNVIKMAQMLSSVSKGRYVFDIVNRVDIEPEFNWENYIAVVNNGGYITPSQLEDSGLNLDNLHSAGAYTAIGSKAVFAAIHSTSNNLNQLMAHEDIKLLREVMPYTELLAGRKDIINSLKEGKVVKAYSAPITMANHLERTRAVAGPWSDESRILTILSLYDHGVKFICQDFVSPKKFSIKLRSKGGKALEESSRYNRICVKYVNAGCASE